MMNEGTAEACCIRAKPDARGTFEMNLGVLLPVGIGRGGESLFSIRNCVPNYARPGLCNLIPSTQHLRLRFLKVTLSPHLGYELRWVKGTKPPFIKSGTLSSRVSGRWRDVRGGPSGAALFLQGRVLPCHGSLPHQCTERRRRREAPPRTTPQRPKHLCSLRPSLVDCQMRHYEYYGHLKDRLTRCKTDVPHREL
jgi:hypothetical protein